MPIPVPTVARAKAYLLNNLTAGQYAITPADMSTAVLVSYGEAGVYQPPDIVIIGRATRTASALAMVGDGGASSLEENYTIEVRCVSWRAGDTTAEAALERAWVMASAVETLVRSDMSLGGLVVEARPRQAADVSEWVMSANDDGTETPLGFTGDVTVLIAVIAVL